MGEVVGLTEPSVSPRLPQAILKKDASPWVSEQGEAVLEQGESDACFNLHQFPSRDVGFG